MTQHDSKIDVREYWRILLRRRWWFLIPVVSAVLTGGIFAFTADPVYQSTVSFSYRRPPQLTRGVGELVQSMSPADGTLDLRGLLTSEEVLKQVIATTGLMHDGRARAWARANQKRYPGMTEEQLTELRLLHDLPRMIHSPRGQSDVLTISLEYSDPDTARMVTQALANAFLAAAASARTDALRAGRDFGEQQLTIYKAKLDSSEMALANFQGGMLRSMVSQDVVTAGNAPLLRTLIAGARLDAEDARQRAGERATAPGGSHTPAERTLTGKLLDGPQPRAIIARLDSLEERSAIADLTHGADDASTDLARSLRMQSLRTRRDLSQAFVERAKELAPGTPDADLEALVSSVLFDIDAGRKEHRRAFLQGLLAAYESRAQRSPDQQMLLDRLERAAVHDRENYETFLRQTMSSRVSENFDQEALNGRYRILDPADRPMEPVRPRRGLIMLLSCACGVILGLAAVFVAEHHDSGYRTIEDIERDLSVEILATLPRIREIRPRAGRDHGVLKSGKDVKAANGIVNELLALESPAAFEMRKLLLRLQQNDGGLPRTILVTSSEAGEGKSVAALLLASELARFARAPVALIDFDLRRPSLDSMLQLAVNGSSVSRALAEGSVGSLVPFEIGSGTLNLLPAGSGDLPPSTLLTEERVGVLLASLTARYAHVVLDSPPVLPTPDPLILARVVEATVFVIRAGAVPRDSIRRGLRMQRNSGNNLIGIVVNDVSEVLPYQYSYRKNPYAYRGNPPENDGRS